MRRPGCRACAHARMARGSNYARCCATAFGMSSTYEPQPVDDHASSKPHPSRKRGGLHAHGAHDVARAGRCDVVHAQAGAVLGRNAYHSTLDSKTAEVGLGCCGWWRIVPAVAVESLDA